MRDWTSTGEVGQVSWSPDGSSILFATPLVRDTGYSDGSYARYQHIALYTIAPSGLDLRLVPLLGDNDLLSAYLCAVYDLAWSPDGSSIAVHGESRGPESWGEFVLTLASDGSDMRLLAHEGKEGQLVPAALGRGLPLDPGVCPAGVAVEEPATYIGLAADREALVAARGTLAGVATLRWGEGPVSGWEEVTVTGSPPRVRELDLRGYTLTGRIPAELGQLSDLQRLDLIHNLLDRFIPSALGSLSNLRTLSLAGKALSGSIPRTFGALTELRELFLARNRLTGGQWELAGLPHLMVVSLESNNFGCVPAGLMDVLEFGFSLSSC